MRGPRGLELDVLPRYLIVHCCTNQAYCVNVRKEGKVRTDACKMILTDLAELNALLAAHLTSNNVKMLETGDTLTGIKNEMSGQLMDSMYSSWNTDTVHGKKVAYTRIDLGLLDIVRKDPPSPLPGRRGAAPAGRGDERTAPATTVDQETMWEATQKTATAAATGGTSSSTPSTGPAEIGRPQGQDRRLQDDPY